MQNLDQSAQNAMQRRTSMICGFDTRMIVEASDFARKRVRPEEVAMILVLFEARRDVEAGSDRSGWLS
jgi:hypothetical protein